MKSPELNPVSERSAVSNEIDKNTDKALLNIENLVKIVSTNSVLINKGRNIVSFYNDIDINVFGYEDKIDKLSKETVYFFQGIDYNKVDKVDIEEIKKSLSNLVQSLTLVSSYKGILDELEVLEMLTDQKDKDEILESIKLLKLEIKEFKKIDYKNTIISNIENNMAGSNRGGGGPGNTNPSFRPQDIGEWEKMEDKKFEIEKKRHELNNPPEDASKKEKASIVDIAEKEAHGFSLTTAEDDLKKKYPILYKTEFEAALKRAPNEESSVEDIALLIVEGKKLDNVQKNLVKDTNFKTKVDDEVSKITAERVQEDVVAEKLAKGTVPSKLLPSEKILYKKNKARIDAKIPDHEESAGVDKEEDIERVAELVATGAVIAAGSPDEIAFKKYESEILALAKTKLEKTENRKQIVQEIALANFNKTPLTKEQKLHLLIPGEATKVADEEKRLQLESLKEDKLAGILADGKVISGLDQDFYDKNKTSIDARVTKKKEEILTLSKEKIISDIVNGVVLSAELEKILSENKAELDPKIMAALKAELVSAEGSGDIARRTAAREKIESIIRTSEKARTAYKPFADQLQKVLNNETYKNLSHKDPAKLSPEEKILLDQYNDEISTIKSNLDKLGPSGQHFVNLEIERAKLAQSSQDFQHSFVRKFPGAKILGVIGGMFGSKWSAMKEGEHTKEAKSKMDSAQIKYDEVRRGLMNTLVDEEHSVRKAFGQDFKNLSTADRDSLDTFISNISYEFIRTERTKLDDMKHVLEGTVRGSAMRQFGNWYSKSFMNFGPFKDNIRARNVAKRIVSAGLLGTVLLPFTGAGALGFMGYRVTRAAISGTVGESAAASIARAFGGKMNSKGEFEKFADKRDAELAIADRQFVNEMMQKFQTEDKPQVTPSIMDTIKKSHAKAVGNYMNRQGNLRRGEMWARLIAGGATAYGLSQMMPGPIPTQVPDHSPVPGPTPIPDSGFKLEGDFVDADSRGAIQSFMNIKEKMINHYMNPVKYPDFVGLTKDQIAEKLLATGKFDDLTGDIMRAHSYDDFVQTTKDHGFFETFGVGNAGVDSESIPAGSIVGMQTDPQGNMQYFAELPNGTRIPINDNFQEALSKYKGVGLIDTTRSGGVGTMGGGAGQVTDGELPPPNTDLGPDDYGQYGPREDVSGGATELNLQPRTLNIVPSTNPTPSINVVSGGSAMNDYHSALEADYQKQWTRLDGDYWKSHPGYNLAQYKADLEAQGLIVKGTQGNDIHTDSSISEIIEGPTHYYSPRMLQNNVLLNNQGYKLLDAKTGLPVYDQTIVLDSNGKPLTMEDFDNRHPHTLGDYNKFMDSGGENMHDKLVDQRYGEYLQSHANEIADGHNPGLTAEEFAKQQEIQKGINNDVDNFINKRFNKDPLFSKPVKGVNTEAWKDLRYDKMSEHFKTGKKGQDIFMGSRKEENFMEDLIGLSRRYHVPMEGNMTVDEFTRRVARAAASGGNKISK